MESKDRHFVSYEADYKFDGPLYATGLVSWEGDRFSGFDSRFSESLGLGYTLLKTDTMNLALTAGPALRQTRYVVGGSDSTLAGRAGASYAWTVLPKLIFTEDASFYGESRNSTLTSNTALTMNVIAALSARASFRVRYESNPPLALENTDTTSTLTLVYAF